MSIGEDILKNQIDSQNEIYKKRLSVPLLIIITVLLSITVFRIFIGMKIPIWIDASLVHDHVWMVYAADFQNHFSNPNNFSLIKVMSYPFFLQIVHILHIPYRLAVVILWIAAAALTTLFIRCITKNPFVLIAVYAFVLFCPIAFTSLVGSVIYRNAITTPAVFIFLACLLLLVYHIIYRRKKYRIGILIAALSGVSFLFFYYLKEDSMWAMPIFIVTLGISVFSVFFKKPHVLSGKERTRYILLALIPILIFVLGTSAYKAVNYHYFGVYEINTRTDSAFADFSARLFKIEDENKTPQAWLPFSTFEKAWAASPTLQAHPELLEALRHSPRAKGDFEANPIGRDHSLWALRDALGSSGLFANEAEKLEVLSSASSEIDEAFADGSLAKDTSRIYVSRAIPGKNISEIMSLTPMFMNGVKTAAFFRWYEVMGGPFPNDLSNQSFSQHIIFTEAFIHDTFATQEEFDQPSVRFSLAAGTAIIKIYQIAAIVLMPLSCIGFVMLIIFALRKTKRSSLYTLYLMTMLGFTAGVHIFAAAWFTEHIRDMAMLGYTMGAIAVIQLFYILGVYTFFKFLFSRKITDKIET